MTEIREFYPGMGQAVAERTILRKKANGQWETWDDVAKRVAFGNSLLCPDSQAEEYLRMYKHLRSATLLMSGRHLQHGDETQPERNLECFVNCASACASFVMFYLLMNGSGVGRAYDDDLMLVDWDNAPNLRCVLDESHPDFDFSAHESVRDAMHKYGSGRDVMWFDIEDTREGWAKGMEVWENAAFEKIHKDKLLILNFSKVRKKGLAIRGMQGRPASGPVPLMNAFNKAATIKGAGLARWKQAIYIDHYFAECVLVGGARRAARMSTKYWRDPTVLDFITVKRPIEYNGKNVAAIKELRESLAVKPHGFLWSSNNSITVDAEFWELLQLPRSRPEYMSEIAIHARKVFKLATEAAYGDGTGEPGFINIHKLNHVTDGINRLDSEFIHSQKYQVEDDSYLYMNRLLKAAKKKQYFMIVNPCVTEDTVVLTDNGAKQVKDLIGEPFVAVVGGKEYQATGFWNTGRKSVYEITTDRGNKVKATHDHCFAVGESWIRVCDLKSGDLLSLCNETGTAKVVSVDYVGTEDVYDCTVSEVHAFDANGLKAHNCGEIPLAIWGAFCTIADVVPYHAATIDEAEDAFRTATRALIRVNLMDSIYGKEVRRTNRIGVGITGIHEFAWKFFGYGFRDLIDEAKSRDFWMTISRFKRAVKDEAERYSKQLGVEVPHTDATIKPAGTTSKLFGLTEGWHLAAMAWYLRWVQFSKNDPLVAEYKAAGYPTRELVKYQNTVIIGFPTSPVIANLGLDDKLVTASEATPAEQYQWLMLGEKYWLRGVNEDGRPIDHDSGNQISYTLKYDPKIVDYKMFRNTIADYQSMVKCCSVMPQEDGSSYEYLPEQPITKAEYEAVASQIERMKVKEDVDFAHVDCQTGACPIDFKK